jgi:hypothetical protein
LSYPQTGLIKVILSPEASLRIIEKQPLNPFSF